MAVSDGRTVPGPGQSGGLFADGGRQTPRTARSLAHPEHTLFAVALLGGSLGAWGGMYCFRHKTRHWRFVVGMPLILVAQLLLAFWLKTKIL